MRNNLIGLWVLSVACSSSPDSPAHSGAVLRCGAGTAQSGDECLPVEQQQPEQDAALGTSDAGSDAPSCELAMLYPDKDGDGFGSALEAATGHCVGTTGFAGNNQDCADEDQRAFPAQPVFYGTPINGAKNVAAFDFNCDGKESLQYPNRGQCSATSHPPGWQIGDATPIPKCGEEAPLNLTKCEETPTTQACN